MLLKTLLSENFYIYTVEKPC